MTNNTAVSLYRQWKRRLQANATDLVQFCYVIQLENNNIYVGASKQGTGRLDHYERLNNGNFRSEEHMPGFVKSHAPIGPRVADFLIEIRQAGNVFVEELLTTLRRFKMHGVDRVRGSCWVWVTRQPTYLLSVWEHCLLPLSDAQFEETVSDWTTLGSKQDAWLESYPDITPSIDRFFIQCERAIEDWCLACGSADHRSGDVSCIPDNDLEVEYESPATVTISTRPNVPRQIGNRRLLIADDSESDLEPPSKRPRVVGNPLDVPIDVLKQIKSNIACASLQETQLRTIAVDAEECRQLPQFVKTEPRLRSMVVDTFGYLREPLVSTLVLVGGVGSGKSTTSLMVAQWNLWDDGTSLDISPTQAIAQQKASELERISVRSSLKSISLKSNIVSENSGVITKCVGGDMEIEHGGVKKKKRWALLVGSATAGIDYQEFLREKDWHEEVDFYVTTPDKLSINLIPTRNPLSFFGKLKLISFDEVHLLQGGFGVACHYLLGMLLELTPLPDDVKIILGTATMIDPISYTEIFTKRPREVIREVHGGAPPIFTHWQNDTGTEEQLDNILNRTLEPMPASDTILHYKSLHVTLRTEPKLTSTQVMMCLPSSSNSIWFADSKVILTNSLEKTHRSIARRLPEDSPVARESIVAMGDHAFADRRAIEQRVANSDTRGLVIFATSAFQEGVNLSNLDVVVQHDVPKCVEDYRQRAGRQGRRPSSPGLALTIVQNESSPVGVLAVKDLEGLLTKSGQLWKLPTHLSHLYIKGLAMFVRILRGLDPDWVNSWFARRKILSFQMTWEYYVTIWKPQLKDSNKLLQITSILSMLIGPLMKF